MPAALDRYFDPESLEIDHRSKDDKGSQEVHDIGQVLPVECFTESSLLIRPREEKMEERNDGSFKFRSSAGVDSCGRESLPNDGFADVCSDEERDTTA